MIYWLLVIGMTFVGHWLVHSLPGKWDRYVDRMAVRHHQGEEKAEKDEDD